MEVLLFKSLIIFDNLTGTSSYSCALLISKQCIILRISSSLNKIDDKLSLVTSTWWIDKLTWAGCSRMHCNRTTIEADFQDDVDSIPAGSTSPSVGGWCRHL